MPGGLIPFHSTRARAHTHHLPLLTFISSTSDDLRVLQVQQAHLPFQSQGAASGLPIPIQGTYTTPTTMPVAVACPVLTSPTLRTGPFLDITTSQVSPWCLESHTGQLIKYTRVRLDPESKMQETYLNRLPPVQMKGNS